jgi:protoheme ferro-lyase
VPLAAPLGVEAQPGPKAYRIGFLSVGAPTEPWIGPYDAVRQRLRETGRAALTAGLYVSFAFQAQPRVLGGFPAATDVE